MSEFIYLNVGDIKFTVKEFKIKDEMTIRRWTPVNGNPSQSNLGEQIKNWIRFNHMNHLDGAFEIKLPLVVFGKTFDNDPFWMDKEIIKAKKVGNFLLDIIKENIDKSNENKLNLISVMNSFDLIVQKIIT